MLVPGPVARALALSCLAACGVARPDEGAARPTAAPAPEAQAVVAASADWARSGRADSWGTGNSRVPQRMVPARATGDGTQARASSDGGAQVHTGATVPGPAGAHAPSSRPWSPRPDDPTAAHEPLEHPEALAAFFDALAAVDDGRATDHVRVLHLGDSVIGADGIPSTLRRRFHARFGDGGPGLVLLGRYMKNYLHRDLHLRDDGWDHCYVAYLCKRDGHYGLGGVTFWSSGGAVTRVRPRESVTMAPWTTVELWLHAGPRGGRLELRLGDGPVRRIDTRAPQAGDRFERVEVPEGVRRVSVRALGHGRVRGYGLVLEGATPGVVWESFSMLGAFTKRLLALDPAHLRAQLARRDPDLLVMSFGGNDLRRVVVGKLDGPRYVEEYLTVLTRLRAARPDLPCLITTIPDHLRILVYDVKQAHVETIVAAHREIARRAGCAFFDTYHAMGGRGAMRAWRKTRPPLAAADLKHLSRHGQAKVAGWIYDAIFAAYAAHRRGATASDPAQAPSSLADRGGPGG